MASGGPAWSKGLEALPDLRAACFGTVHPQSAARKAESPAGIQESPQSLGLLGWWGVRGHPLLSLLLSLSWPWVEVTVRAEVPGGGGKEAERPSTWLASAISFSIGKPSPSQASSTWHPLLLLTGPRAASQSGRSGALWTGA